VRARYSEFSPSPNFAQLHGRRLAASGNVEVVLGANVTELVPDPALTTIDTVTARSLRGCTVDVRAAVFVLCVGGLETARVMLCSDTRSEGGVGNAHDLVGRFFQDHPGLEIGDIEVADRRRLRRAFQLRSRDGVKYAPLFSAAEEMQRAERIGHAGGTVLFGRRADSDVAAKTLLRAIRPSEFRAQARAEAPAAIRALLRDPIPVVRSASRRFVLRRPGSDTSGTPTLIVGGEQVPNPNSRVRLVDDRDELGMRRLALDWRVTELDLRSWRLFAEVVAAELERLELGRVRLDLERLPDDPSQVSHLVDAGHHMGTARMSDDPRRGVVDSECRVHGLENLFLAGSSVFPTSGFSNPTFTILALTLRLAERTRALVSDRAVAHSA
jgi:choline dehydrogenase-like flavoprotein